MGASGPSDRLAPTPQMVPTHLASRLRSVSRCGTALPFRYAITSDTPDPLAAGAQNCTCAARHDVAIISLNLSDPQVSMYVDPTHTVASKQNSQ